jgi:hypothetical protein
MNILLEKGGCMAKDVELSSLDLRYEDHRMKNAALEERLLASIAQRGIEELLSARLARRSFSKEFSAEWRIRAGGG